MHVSPETAKTRGRAVAAAFGADFVPLGDTVSPENTSWTALKLDAARKGLDKIARLGDMKGLRKMKLSGIHRCVLKVQAQPEGLPS